MMFSARILVVLGVVLGTSAFAEKYTLDNNHSMVIFSVEHIGISKLYGRFNGISGTFTLDDLTSALQQVSVSIKADSIDTNLPRRDTHLKSADFLDAQKHPAIAFTSTKVEEITDKAYKVTGNLLLHGVTREITLEMNKTGEGNDPWGGYRLGAAGSFTVKRSEFGMAAQMAVAGDEIELLLGFEGVRN